MMIAARAGLPMTSFWGTGITESSDGQFFPAARRSIVSGASGPPWLQFDAGSKAQGGSS